MVRSAGFALCKLIPSLDLPSASSMPAIYNTFSNNTAYNYLVTILYSLTSTI
jgi:hypothetical protein